MSAENKEIVNALDSSAREGYFGNRDPNTASNKGEDRLVLDENYGKPKGVVNIQTVQGLMEFDKTGLAGRYVGKVVIVTGGSKGIGEGCVRCFFAAGANVVFCSRAVPEGKAMEASLNSESKDNTNRALYVRCDVSKVYQVRNLIDSAVAAFGRIDCLINNAGWHPPPNTIDNFSVDDMQDLFQLNFISYFAACKYALPHLRKTAGNIINMSSWVGAFGQGQAPTYAATKGAITSFSKALAIDEATAKTGVRVNVVSPGNIWTPLWKSWSDGENDPKAARDAGDIVQVMGRKGTIFETGRLCLAIAADLTFTTGIDHIQSGGAELGYGVRSNL